MMAPWEWFPLLLSEHSDGKTQLLPSLSGSAEFIIVAELSGGDGDTSWQQAQLFRQSLKETDESAFEILVQLEDA